MSDSLNGNTPVSKPGGGGKVAASIVMGLLLAGAAVFAVVQWKSHGNSDVIEMPTPETQNGRGGNEGSAVTVPHVATNASATSVAITTSTTPEPDYSGWKAPTFGEERAADRNAMVERIHDYYRLTDKPTLDAMRLVPRHLFVPEAEVPHAYEDSPRPIDNGQLISQPWIVALMTLKLQLNKDSKVLEIGTGSAYQSAVLTYLTPHVYSIEVIGALATAAKDRLNRLGYTTVQTRHGDGFYGWAEAAPFDAIIVTCAAGEIPHPLVEQLKPGGRMMIPVGQPFATQSLMLVNKDEAGAIHTETLEPVRFVPMISEDPSKPK